MITDLVISEDLAAVSGILIVANVVMRAVAAIRQAIVAAFVQVVITQGDDSLAEE